MSAQHPSSSPQSSNPQSTSPESTSETRRGPGRGDTPAVAVSADGTEIAYQATGSGPVLVVVEGALCQRSMGVAKTLTPTLRRDFTVVAYDRRGRGASGAGATPYDVQREVEDLAAVIDAVGGEACVFGASSGGALALEAARQGVPMRRLGVYEAPFIVDDSHPPVAPDLADRIAAMVADGRRGAAVKTFLRTVGAPAPVVALMPLFPVWGRLTSVAHTLPYDFAITLGFQQGRPLPAGHFASVSVPTIVVAGGRSPAYLHAAQEAVADQVPDAELVDLPGQTHVVKARATAPVLQRFFG